MAPGLLKLGIPESHIHPYVMDTDSLHIYGNSLKSYPSMDLFMWEDGGFIERIIQAPTQLKVAQLGEDADSNALATVLLRDLDGVPEETTSEAASESNSMVESAPCDHHSVSLPI